MLVIIVVYLLWGTQFLFFPLPEKSKLLSESGMVTEIQPIFKNNRIQGYKIHINDQVYIASWLDFKLTKDQFKDIFNQTNLSILYHKNCDFFCKKYIYEIHINKTHNLSFDFFKNQYSRDRAQKTQAIPYALSVMILLVIICHLYAKKFEEV